MSCTYKIHPFSLGNHLGTSLVNGNLMIIRTTSVEWTWLGLQWPLAQYVALYMGDKYHQYLDAKHHASLLSNFLLENPLYFGVHEMTSF